jgi:hypothetical protein
MRQAIDAAARLARTQCDRRLVKTWRYSKEIEATAAARASGKTFLARLRNLASSRGIDAAPTIDAVARAGATRPTPGGNLALLEINCSDRRAARVWKNLFSRDLLSLFLSLSQGCENAPHLLAPDAALYLWLTTAAARRAPCHRSAGSSKNIFRATFQTDLGLLREHADSVFLVERKRERATPPHHHHRRRSEARRCAVAVRVCGAHLGWTLAPCSARAILPAPRRGAADPHAATYLPGD